MAKGQAPFHPVSMYLLRLSRRETLRLFKSKDDHSLWYRLGFEEAFRSLSGLRYFEGQIDDRMHPQTVAHNVPPPSLEHSCEPGLPFCQATIYLSLGV